MENKNYVFVLGPSGVGKTTILNAAVRFFPQAIFCNLDDIASKKAAESGIIAEPAIAELYKAMPDKDRFLEFGLASLQHFDKKHPGKHIIVDLGAGFLDAPRARTLHRQFQLIAFKCRPEDAYH